MTNLKWNEISDIVISNISNKHPDEYSVLHEYISRYKEKPSLIKIISEEYDNYFKYDKVISDLKIKFKNIKLLYSNKIVDLKQNLKYNKHEVYEIADGYIFEILLNDNIKSPLIEYNYLYTPPNFSRLYNETVSDIIIEIFNNHKILLDRDNSTYVGMVCASDGEYFVDYFNIKSYKDKLQYPDLHYGEGFSEFNESLLKKLEHESKGLILFHGETGTGKTFYLKYLLKKLSKMNKNVLYFSPLMVDFITDPSFINFIAEWASKNNKGILLIEDAEPLLESRDNVRNMGITNLLNITDGILNDILELQIICTFNTKLSNIDNALLREERLIARKEFNKLPKNQAIELCKKINIDQDIIDNKIKTDMSLAEIYSIKKNSSMLIHDVKEKNNQIGFKK